MGSIETSIQLYDGTSGTLQKINNVVSKTIQRFDDMNDHFDGAFNEGAFESAKNGFNTINILINKIENNIDRSTTSQQTFTEQVQRSAAAENEMLSSLKSIDTTMKKIDDDINQANTHQQKFNNSMQMGHEHASNLWTTIKGVAAGMLAAQVVMGGLQAIGNSFNMSDELTLTAARLNLIKEKTQTIASLQNDIFNASERSRASYTDTAAAVAKLGLLAGKAFKSNDEIIAFTELMNKNFVVGGASATEQAAAMYQLTQAMSSGRLQGDEYVSIIENAPLLAKSIEDYMRNVKKAEGTMKDWSSQGLLTADVIKAALFNTGDEINKMLGDIPITWANIAQSIKNNALIAFQPVLVKMNQLANSEKFQAFKTNLITALQNIGMEAMKVLNAFISIVNFFSSNWDIISPFIWAVVAAMIAYNAVSLITTGILAAQALAEGISGAAKALSTGATLSATVAQYGLNAALLACPLTWIIILVLTLIAIFYAVVAAINHFAGTSYSVAGLVAGAFLWLAALIGNVIIGAINGIIQALWTKFVEPFIGIIEWVLNVANGGFDSFGAAVSNLIGQIISWFLSLGKIVTKIIDAIFGTNWTDGLSALQDKVLSWGKNDKAITLDRNAPGINYRFDLTDAFKTGNDWGNGLPNSMKNLFKSKDDEDNKNKQYDYNDMYNNIAATANNTGKMAKAVNISDEDLKYLHDVAEREAINRFTTAEIKVDMTNHNNISGTKDIDGIIEYLRDEVETAMSRSAEGVS